MNDKSPKTYNWLVDRIETDRNQDVIQVHVREEGFELRLDRWAFGRYAAVDMAYVDTKEPFKLVPAAATSTATS